MNSSSSVVVEAVASSLVVVVVVVVAAFVVVAVVAYRCDSTRQPNYLADNCCLDSGSGTLVVVAAVAFVVAFQLVAEAAVGYCTCRCLRHLLRHDCTCLVEVVAVVAAVVVGFGNHCHHRHHLCHPSSWTEAGFCIAVANSCSAVADTAAVVACSVVVAVALAFAVVDYKAVAGSYRYHYTVDGSSSFCY